MADPTPKWRRKGMVGRLIFLGLFITGIVFMCLDGTRGPNRYGPDPKQPAGDLGNVFA